MVLINLELLFEKKKMFVPQTFDELLELAERGDHREVDMLVKDIYGGAYSSIGLSGDIIASSFGKAARSPKKSGVLIKRCYIYTIKAINELGGAVFLLYQYIAIFANWKYPILHI